MKLRPELSEMLSGFEKRMKLIDIAKYLLDYSYERNEKIKAMIPEKDILDNLIAAVLVFVKERTLGSEQKCTLEDISDFLEDISILLPECCRINAAELARFIVVEVLQKGGVLTNYTVLSPERECFALAPVRLIEEERGSYHLTDDAFDFLFRSKEIESELDYSVTRFRMAEYMKRDNYTQALDQSRELVSKIRNMKISMDDFMRRCRENIAKISIDQYETVISRVRSLLETEYEELQVIQNNARERAAKLTQARQSGVGKEDVQKSRRALQEIIQNIQQTIAEQRGLINKKLSLSEAYGKILSDSYAMNRYERLNFDADILLGLRNGSMPLDTASVYLLFPLTRPAFRDCFSVENFYAMQTKITQQKEDEGEFIEETEEEDPAEARNARYLAICTEFFGFLVKKEAFKISEFAASLRDDVLYDFCEEKALPQVILALYSLQRISASDWKQNRDMIVQPMGEFELSWCMSEMPESCLNFDYFTIDRIDREFSFTVTRDGRQNKISMSDFAVEVKK